MPRLLIRFMRQALSHLKQKPIVSASISKMSAVSHFWITQQNSG
jgi:hypothetical protein